MKQKKLLERILGIILTISIIITVIPTNLVAVQAANHKIYQQSYSAWKNYPYGKGGTIANTIINKGCGVLATVNAVTYLTGKELNPKAVADWAMKNGEYCTGVGSNWTIAKNSANRFGSEYGYKSCGYYSISSKVKTMPSKCTDGKTYYDYPRTSSDMRTVWNELTRHLENGETCVTLVAHHFIAIVDYDKIKDNISVQ